MEVSTDRPVAGTRYSYSWPENQTTSGPGQPFIWSSRRGTQAPPATDMPLRCPRMHVQACHSGVCERWEWCVRLL
eukprot:2393362-Rhodomonas_salina.1